MFKSQFRPLLEHSKRKLSHIRFQGTAGKSSFAKKGSSLPLIISSFIVGSVTAHFLPISTLFKEFINEKLPSQEPEISKFKEKLERKAEQLPIFQRLLNDKDYRFIRAWNYIDESSQHLDGNYNISSTTLSVPGGIAIKPYVFCNDKTKETVTIIHVGERLCGYPFLIHGGIMFTILDEVLKRAASYKYGIDIVNDYKPTKIKTDRIELKYRFPTFANNFIIIQSKLTEDGKVTARVEDSKGKLLVESVGEFQPL